MKEHKVQLTHFVKEDRFELNMYLTFLFKQFKSRCSSQLNHENGKKINNGLFKR